MSTNGDITLTIHNGKPARRTAQSSERSSASDEDSTDTGVHIPSGAGTQEYSDQDSLGDEDDYTLLSKEEVGPSESASRLSSQPDPSRSLQSRHRSHREVERHPRRDDRLRRARRQPHHSPEESELGSHEDLGDGYGPDPYLHHPPQPRPRPASYHWQPPHGPAAHPGYGPGYPTQGGFGGQFPPPPPPGDQLMRVRNGYGGPQYPMQYQQPGSPPVQSPYYGQGHPGMHGAMPPPIAPQPGGFGGSDMMHQQFIQPNMPHAMGQQGYFPQYPAQSPFAFQQPQVIQAPPHIVYMPNSASPAPQVSSTKSTTPAPEATKTPPPAATAAAPGPPPPPPENKLYEELKQMMLNERKDREEREAKQKAEEEAKLKKAEEDKKKADEIAAAAKAAAAKAKDEAEKKAAEEKEEAAKKAADEAAKIKKEAEDAMKKAAAKAAEDAKKAKEEHEKQLAAMSAPPPEKQKPIRFKDAVGRKFNFPFHLCATWEGMEDLIRQAFMHVDVIGQHVAEGHYDLIGPNNEIILPAVWETVIEPDWAITMHMWPLPEEPEPLPPDDGLMAGLDAAFAAAAMESGKPKKGKGKDKLKDKAKGPAGHPPLPAGVEILNGPMPPPPPLGPMGPGLGPGPDGSSGGAPKKKAAKSSGGGWGAIFGGPKPKAKGKQATKKGPG